MTNDSNTTSNRKPDFIAHAVRSQGGDLGPKYTRIGVGFNQKNGGIGVMYDATPLSGQIVLLEPDADKPSSLSYGHPTRKPDFSASMVRDGNEKGKGFWTEVGSAFRQEGYISILLDVVPQSKLLLSLPKEKA